MFLRQTRRHKDGKTHTYWNIVENKRLDGGRVVQRHVLYLGEINSSQVVAWRKAIKVLDEAAGEPRTLALFPEDCCDAVSDDASVVRLRLSELQLHRPRQWGACWLAGQLGGNSGWTASGRSAWRRAARAHAGIRSCKFWCPTGSLPRAASGSCTGIGSARAPWPTCWVRTSGWRKRTNFTLAMTGFWHTRRHCSLIWWSAGGPCSTPISRSCCTT